MIQELPGVDENYVEHCKTLDIAEKLKISDRFQNYINSVKGFYEKVTKILTEFTKIWGQVKIIRKF